MVRIVIHTLPKYVERVIELMRKYGSLEDNYSSGSLAFSIPSNEIERCINRVSWRIVDNDLRKLTYTATIPSEDDRTTPYILTGELFAREKERLKNLRIPLSSPKEIYEHHLLNS